MTGAKPFKSSNRLFSNMSNVDAILVYKLAWQLAQAFSTGRKSAPAEVREVENQLYSLSAALAAFKKLLDGGDVNHVLDAWSDEADDDDDGGGGGGGGMTSIRRILSNCEETLRRLEELVQKYNIIGGQKTTPSDPSSSPPPLSTRLTHNITKDYKKMTWLTQKADLTALRSQLMVHTNSLNLVMGVLVK